MLLFYFFIDLNITIEKKKKYELNYYKHSIKIIEKLLY